MELANSLYLTDIMHLISQALLTPTIILLIFFVGYALWCIGSIIVESFTERLNFRAQMPQFLAKISSAQVDEVPSVIIGSGLLNRQKEAMLTLWDYRMLPEETYVALAKRLIANEDQRYQRIVGRTDAASKISPMFGLMGTLIPLGPGIVALGQGDTTTLASSIGVAFDTTVCGLITAAVSFVVSKIRSGWYENYMTSLEGAMTAILEIVADMRDRGAIDITEPGHAARDNGFATRGNARRVAEDTIAQQRGGAQGAPVPPEEGKPGVLSGSDTTEKLSPVPEAATERLSPVPEGATAKLSPVPEGAASTGV